MERGHIRFAPLGELVERVRPDGFQQPPARNRRFDRNKRFFDERDNTIDDGRAVALARPPDGDGAIEAKTGRKDGETTSSERSSSARRS
jgi:hypothetical protein